MALGKYPSALSDYEYVSKDFLFWKIGLVYYELKQVRKVCPNDKDATMKYEECKKIVTRIRFEKAIAVDESAKSVVSQIDLSTMSMFCNLKLNIIGIYFSAIETDYDGPHLQGDDRVTKEFMLELLPYLQNQKKLHKKYAYQV